MPAQKAGEFELRVSQKHYVDKLKDTKLQEVRQVQDHNRNSKKVFRVVCPYNKACGVLQWVT